MLKLVGFWIVFISLLLSGCQTIQRVNQVPKTALNTVPKTWSINAKVGVQLPDSYTNLSVDWHYHNENFTLRLTAPLFFGSMEVRKQAGIVRVDDRIIKQPIEQWMYEQYGWFLPMDKMAQWLFVGYQHDVNWQVDYLSHQAFGEWVLPNKIRLTHNKGRIIMTVVIKEITPQ